MAQKKLICLNCFHSIAPSSVYFLCPNYCRNCTLKKIKPNETRHFFRAGIWQRITNSLLGNVPRKANCPCLGEQAEAHIQYSIERHCPLCLAPFHKEAGLGEEIVLGIIGMPGSGKTEYIRSLEFSIQQRFSFRRVLFNKAIGNPRTDFNKTASPTPAGFLYPPQLFRLGIRDKETKAAPLIAFFDVSGTEWQKMDAHALRFLPYCSGLVILSDPLSNPKILQMLMEIFQPPDPLYPQIKACYENPPPNHLKAVVDEILANLNTTNQAIPIALVVNKSDLLRHPHIFPKHSAIHFNSPDPFQVEDHISNLVEQYFSLYEPGIYSSLKNWRTNEYLTNYFATSTLGQSYHNNELERRPIRLLEPFLWILQRLNIF